MKYKPSNIFARKPTKEELEDMQTVYECIFTSLHGIRRALSLNKHALVKSLGLDIYDRLVAMESAAKTALKEACDRTK